LALFLSLSSAMEIRIDSGLYIAALGGIFLVAAYVLGRGAPAEGDLSTRAAA
jgi:hypothetical protein